MNKNLQFDSLLRAAIPCSLLFTTLTLFVLSLLFIAANIANPPFYAISRLYQICEWIVLGADVFMLYIATKAALQIMRNGTYAGTSLCIAISAVSAATPIPVVIACCYQWPDVIWRRELVEQMNLGVVGTTVFLGFLLKICIRPNTMFSGAGMRTTRRAG